MRKWKRVDTATAHAFVRRLASHEAALLESLVTSMVAMLEERESSSPADELEEITGLKTGNSRPPEDETMKRLLPDFFRPQNDRRLGHRREPQQRAAQPARARDHRRQTQAAQRVLDTVPNGGGRFELTEDDAHAWAAAVNDVRLALGTMLDIGPEGPDRLPPDHPMAGHFDVYQWLTVLQEYLVLGLMDKK